MANFEVLKDGNAMVKAWTKGVLFEEQAREQVMDVARMPFIHKHVAVMPDVHYGKGATVGSVIATKRAIIPAAVGVDIGCGMSAQKTNLSSHDLPENLHDLRIKLEAAVPVGRGLWCNDVPNHVADRWRVFRAHNRDGSLDPQRLDKAVLQLGTLGGGNHFIELCLDEHDNVWVMLHSGSRGLGNEIGRYHIEKAKNLMDDMFIDLENKDLAYIPQNHPLFDAYWRELRYAQAYALANRETMMDSILRVLQREFKDFECEELLISCHHNYVDIEHHFGENVFVTRKGAVRARKGDYGIIPSAMGGYSYIVQGKGNPQSFHSCSHGAGRKMSRREAHKTISLEQHKKAVQGVECRVDKEVLDESPAAYKDINKVMAAQEDLVDILYTLKAVLNIKG